MTWAAQHLLDREDHGRFLIEYGFSVDNADVVTHYGERHYLPMDGISVKKSLRDGDGLFAKKLFHAGDVIAPALLERKKTEAGRYTNHSAMPNARMAMKDANNIDLVAIQEIADEEITVDYRSVLNEIAK